MTRRDEDGFALLELLIALAVISMIGVMLGGMMQRSVHLAVDGGLRLTAAQQSQTVRALLRRQLQSAMPLLLPSAAGPRSGFHGELGSIRWVGSGDGGRDDIHLLQVDHLAVRSDQRSGALILHRRLLDPTRSVTDQTSPTETVTLIEDVADLEIAYFSGDAWREHWSDPTALPALIRIDLRPDEDADWRWPSLVVAPRLAGALHVADSREGR